MDYILAYMFAKLETTKHNIDKFFFQFIALFIKLIIKKLLYYKANK